MSIIDIFTRTSGKESNSENSLEQLYTQEELSLRRLQEEYNQQQETTRLMKSNRCLRSWLPWVIIGIVILWLLVVAGITCAAGFKVKGFSLDTSVLITLISGSTVNVIGLLLLVVKDVFPGNRNGNGK